jgi:hypothetical protein
MTKSAMKVIVEDQLASECEHGAESIKSVYRYPSRLVAERIQDDFIHIENDGR